MFLIASIYKISGQCYSVILKDFQGHANNDCSTADWIPSKYCYVIDLMLVEVYQGKKIVILAK